MSSLGSQIYAVRHRMPQQYSHLLLRFQSSNASSLGAILEEQAAALTERLPTELLALPLFAAESQTRWSAMRRNQFATGVAHSYCKDKLLPVLLDKLVPESQLVTLTSAYQEDLALALLTGIAADSDLGDAPSFARTFLRVPPKVLGAGHRSRNVIRAEQLAAAFTLSRLRAAECSALARLLQALGASSAQIVMLRPSSACEEVLAKLMAGTEVTTDLRKGVSVAAQSGFTFAMHRQLLLWKQIGDYTLSVE